MIKADSSGLNKVNFEDYAQWVKSEWIDTKLEQVDKFEKENSKLPDWYCDWFMSKKPFDKNGPVSIQIDDIPPAYAYTVWKIREKLMKLLSNETYFCVEGDRNEITKELKELVNSFCQA